MTETVLLGEITCPSGELVLMDGGYLGLWSGDGVPHGETPAVDYEIVGPDAEAAARSFDRQSGRMLYDIPEHGVADFTAFFDEHCRQRGLDATPRPLPRQVAHRDRVRRAVAGGDPDFLITGVSVVPVAGIPSDRPLRVVATAHRAGGWAQVRIEVGGGRAVASRQLGDIAVDCARFVFADADALSHWVHDAPIDGLADVVFWGLHEVEIAAEFGAGRTGVRGDDHYGWLNLPVAEAHAKAVALDDRRAAGDRRFAFDFRPHSHHWQVMAGVRAAEHEAAAIEVGGASVLFAMTSVGDGFFPVHVEVDALGAPVAVRVTIQDDDE
ncbi:hypothetical protein R8Z50_04280 [Longispora sp. K20-0274]|uniref:hypothetical protein n=1 Tax=Longispora sp. K20-0274 TaxID=3088255 RepID=UPI00399B72CB